MAVASGGFYTKGKVNKRVNILVIRWKRKSQELGDSKPCALCAHMMKLYGVYRVYYSDGKGNLVEERITDLETSTCTFSKGLINNREYMRHSKLPIPPEVKATVMESDFI